MPFRHIVLAAMIAGGSALPALPLLAQAQVQPAADLYDVLQIEDVIAVLREEGIADAHEMATAFGQGGGGSGWAAAVERIYDPDRMRTLLKQNLARAMAGHPEAAAQATLFFQAPTGKRALELETKARRALLDKDAERAAALRWQQMVADGDPKVALIRRFAEVNDLVEANVAGTMNSSLAFYQGLAATGGPFADMTEEDMLDLARGKEGENRASTEEWLFPFLALAYEPLHEDELRAYIAYSETPGGQVLNTAMFAAFNDLFNAISQDLGQSVGREMAGQDI